MFSYEFCETFKKHFLWTPPAAASFSNNSVNGLCQYYLSLRIYLGELFHS